MENRPTSGAVLLIAPSDAPVTGAGEEVVRFLRAQLAGPVALGTLRGDRPAVAALRELLVRGARKVTVVPLDASEAPANLPAALNAVRAQQPALVLRAVAPLALGSELVAALAENARAALAALGQPAEAVAVVLLGSAGPSSEQNAELARAARLLWEQLGVRGADYAFLERARPDLGAMVERAAREGATGVVVVPALWFGGTRFEEAQRQVAALRQRVPGVPLALAAPLGAQAGVVRAVLAAVAAAAARAEQLDTSLAHTHGSFRHRHPLSAIDAILPPRYRGGVVVSAAPMGAAELVYDEHGQVAWDRMWGRDDPTSPFCELALAGGPPHRGELLEPVSPAEVEADWAGYSRVVAELTRGIQLTTGLPVVLSRVPGWIGVRCRDEEMAIWLLRAIIVENVFARREGEVLYLPAGPSYRLEKEIKNVITALAKTYHYWSEHLQASGDEI
ncbi:MAG: sirohydrochlorin chelatase [Chloroflexi bacterium]|nr:sirohydrochlorin chelatase [Chloroflexota bacterium]